MPHPQICLLSKNKNAPAAHTIKNLYANSDAEVFLSFIVIFCFILTPPFSPSSYGTDATKILQGR